MKLAKGSWSWILMPFLSGILLMMLSMFIDGPMHWIILFLSILLFLLLVLLLIFFRDPERTSGEGIIAVADGIIQNIEKRTDEDVGSCLFISTFMNIHNVHVNRVPYDGMIITRSHHAGSHLPAFTKESERNERMVYVLKTTIGPIKIVQIAGTLARRIKPYIDVDTKVKKGDRLGIIRLGSRVDVYLPSNQLLQCSVKIGQRVQAGADSLATIND
jgi:phosphatidylserine decarboxylase